MTRREKFFAFGTSIFSIFFVICLAPAIYFVATPITEKEILNYTLRIGIIITHIATATETILTKGKQLEFWELQRKLRNLYRSNQDDFDEAYRAMVDNFKRKIWLIVIMYTSIEAILLGIMLIISHGEPTRSTKIFLYGWILIFYPTKAGRTRHLSHIMAIEMLKKHVEFFNSTLRDIKVKLRSLSKEKSVEELNLIKFRHIYIWELCRNINSSFKWSQFVNICVNCFQFICMSFYLYIHIVTKNLTELFSEFMLY
uniref:Gustatory receptor n=2 Tax=Lutzomyia longipalpis TaxID=7200 RepID=A0A240SXY9_LUTLO